MFMEKFSAYASEGDSITCEVDGFKCTATIYRDYDIGEPWKEHDGHGPVSEWTTRDKEPGERVLASDRMGNGRRLFYDFAAAVKLARLDGWGLPNDEGKDLTPGQIAERAAEKDFERLKAWCDDEWHWAGIAVTVSRDGVELTDQYDHALWGIDGNWKGESSDYLTEVANDLLDDALEAAKRRLDSLMNDADSVVVPRATLTRCVSALTLLGNYIGNKWSGGGGIEAFDRCAIIGEIRALLETREAA